MRETLHAPRARVRVRGTDLFAHFDRSFEQHYGIFFTIASAQHLGHVIERRRVLWMIRPERRLFASERLGVQIVRSVDVVLRESTPREIV